MPDKLAACRTDRGNMERIEASGLDLKDQVISINRVTKVVKGGKNLSFAALVVVVGLGVLVQRRTRDALPSAVARSGLALLAAILILILVSLVLPPNGMPQLAVYISFNLLYYAVVIWLIYVGYQRGDAFRVNAGFVFFVLGVLFLYFDTLWSLMERSFFFIGGGLLLCAGGYVLEAQRRRLLRGPERPETEGGMT